MSALPSILKALARMPGIDLPGESVETGECEGALFHSPRPLRVHLVDLGQGRWVRLCGTCRDNVAVLMLLEHSGIDDVPWRRGFGNKLRMLISEENDG